MSDQFTKNLRYLCGPKGSISQVCREIGINRQQFNKYLNRQSKPSAHNLQRLCEYFRVSEAQLYLPHHEFIKLHELAPNRLFEQQIQATLGESSKELKRYLGYYHSHCFSLGYHGKIIRSLVCLYEHQGQYFSKSIERLLVTDHSGHQHRYITKYTGVASMSCNRLFLAEKEMLWGQSFTMTILYPSYQSHISQLHGISTGCPTRGRVPSSTRVMYQFLGRNVNKYQALKKCGLFDANSGEFSEELLGQLENRIDPDATSFQAATPYFK